MTERVIYLDGRHVLTTEQVAGRWNVKPSSARATLGRAGVHPDDHLDSRTPVYYPETIAAVSRPGRGVRPTDRSGSSPAAR